MANVEYRNVGKKYGAVEVLKGLDLDVKDGEFAVLLGASGCGKTTLLRMTAGLETITDGTIKIADAVVNNVPPRDRNIAMVFQNYALYPTMKVRDNIGFSLEVAKLPKEEIDKRVNEAAKVLNLTEYLDRKPAELSGGQRQRVAMGRAMVRDAKVFLFDEPLSNLDAKLRAHMRVEIRQLHDRLGATTIYVTHDQIEAMTMADKIVLMEGGRIVQMGSPDDLYDRPNSLYVAEFIGTPAINKLHGEIDVEAGAPVFKNENTSLPLKKGYEKFKGTKIVLGIRPNDVHIEKSGPIEGLLELPETTGADVHLHMRVGETEFIGVVPRHTKFKLGEKIRFGAKPEQLHVFDAASGQRLEV